MPRFRALPRDVRWGIAIGLEILLAILLFFVDHSLGYAVAAVSALYWIHRLPRIPWRLAAQVAIVAIFLATGVTSLALALALAFAVFWIPQRYRGRALPVVAIALAVLYPFYQPKM